MSKHLNEETRGLCPQCKRSSVGPGEKVCASCSKATSSMPHQVKEMGAGGVVGFQLPLGSKREAFDKMIKQAGDINEAQVVVFLKHLNEAQALEVAAAFEINNHDFVANMVREHVVRQAVRQKISEVVRKKAGGGGYTLYAPNKGKKHGAQPVGTFPTKLAAKRAELARFPPKDPKKVARLRKEVDKLMKDPKKRAEAEKKAMQQHGTDTPHKPHHAGKARGHKYESKILSTIIVKSLNEGLFREDAQGSEWDEFIKKMSDRAMSGDKGFQRVMGKIDAELNKTLGQSLKIVQKQLGANAKVKPMGTKRTDDGRTYVAFKVVADTADVGPIYVYSDNGIPRIELSDEAKSAFAKVAPGTVTAVRGALSTAQDALENQGGLRDLISQRDEYLGKLQAQVDKMVSGMSPVQVAILKQLLIKKYRGTK